MESGAIDDVVSRPEWLVSEAEDEIVADFAAVQLMPTTYRAQESAVRRILRQWQRC